MTGRVATAALLWLIVGASPAKAGDVGIMVVTVADGPVAAPEVSAALARAGVASGDVVAADALGTAQAAVRAGAVPRARLAPFRRVRELVDDGWRAYQQVSADRAAVTLERARVEAEAVAALDGGIEVYADVVLRLGAVLDHLGRRDEAAEWLRLAWWLDPGRLVTTAEFSPDVVAAFDAARAYVPATVAVRVTAGAGAILEVDGRAVRATPNIAHGGRLPTQTTTQMIDVLVGQHLVVARGPDGQARAAGLRAAAAWTVPDGAGEGTALATPGEPGTAMLRDALVFAELDAVVVAAAIWRHGAPALIAQRCEAGSSEPVACTKIIEVPFDRQRGGLDPAVAAAWRALRTARVRQGEGPTLAGDPRIAAERAPRRTAGCGWCRNPWIWAGAGAAVATLGAVAAIAWRDDDVTIVTVDTGEFTGR